MFLKQRKLSIGGRGTVHPFASSGRDQRLTFDVLSWPRNPSADLHEIYSGCLIVRVSSCIEVLCD